MQHHVFETASEVDGDKGYIGVIRLGATVVWRGTRHHPYAHAAEEAAEARLMTHFQKSLSIEV